MSLGLDRVLPIRVNEKQRIHSCADVRSLQWQLGLGLICLRVRKYLEETNGIVVFTHLFLSGKPCTQCALPELETKEARSSTPPPPPLV